MRRTFKKLMKARDDKKVLSGVLGGFSRFLGIDDFVFRLLFFIIAFFSGLWFTFLVVYIVAAFIMEDYDPEFDNESHYGEDKKL